MKKFLKENLSFILIIIIVILIRCFVVTPVRVNGSSMSPTLEEKEVSEIIERVREARNENKEC